MREGLYTFIATLALILNKPELEFKHFSIITFLNPRIRELKNAIKSPNSIFYFFVNIH